MSGDLLDDFEDLSGWRAIMSEPAQLRIVQDAARAPGHRGKAMRLDFDFQGGGGFVVARKTFDLTLPERYRFSLLIRGQGPSNILEFKLIDASNQNVWRYRVEAFDLPADWRRLEIASREIDFAWGPLGGGPARAIATIELVVAAGPGGRGTVWLADLRLADTSYYLTPRVTASSALPGCEPDRLCGASPTTGWRSAATDAPQRLTIDFQCAREYGGLVIRWDRDRRPSRCEVRLSDDGQDWRRVFAADQGVGEDTHVYLPNTASRYVTIDLEPGAGGQGVGIRAIEVAPFDFSRSLNAFFAGVAQRAPAGRYPKYLLGRQTYWTPVGTGVDVTQALINEEGMVEVDKGSFSLEPFLHLDGRLVTWADAEITQGLAQGYLPIPFAEWRLGDLTLVTTAFATRIEAAGGTILFIRYRLASGAEQMRRVRLFATIRPFQVTPTWQHWHGFGGASAIGELAFIDGVVWVDRRKRVVPLTPPAGFGAAAFAQGTITEHLASGEPPAQGQVADPFGHASGALSFDLALGPHAAQEIYLAIPFGEAHQEQVPAGSDDRLRRLDGSAELARALAAWEEMLGAFAITLPPSATEVVATMKTVAAHILINRDGPALQPGPRRYSRSWIRDGALMAAALARIGRAREGADFVRWYAGFLRTDGNLPDCVDRDGCEWLPEFDGWGELIFAVMDHYRFTGDRTFVAEMWPAVRRCVDYLEGLRARRLTAEFRTDDKRAYYGLLPESMSHEGYMAHPVHAYWDDFWALRGFKDAAALAEALGERKQGQRIAALAEDFQQDLHASLRRVIETRGIDFVPGSVDLADYDPAATAIAITLADRRIRPWNQWPEISWRDPDGPSFIGDMPHSWIGAEYILAVRSLFVYEREADQSLVIAAGIPDAWLADGGEIRVQGLPTQHGRLSYRLRRERSDACRVSLAGDVRVPPGGLVVQPPLPGPLVAVEIDGQAAGTPADTDGARCHICPAELWLRC